MANTRIETRQNLGGGLSRRTLFTVVIIYLVFVVIISMLFLKTANDAVCIGGYITCLEPNQIGDVLAGVFAPLAFFWLVAAVWMQGKELRNQEIELEMQKKAADDQAKAIEVQFEQAKKQTEILEKQLKTFSNAEIKSLVEQLHLLLYERINRKIAFGPEPGEPVLNFDDNILIDDALHKMSAALSGWALANGDRIRSGEIKMGQRENDEFAEIRYITSAIFNRVDYALEDQRARIRTIDLKQLDEAISIFLTCPFPRL